MRYVLFGTGDYYERYKKWFPFEDVLALADNSPAKQGSIIDGIVVMSPKNAVALPYDKIVILSFYYLEMKKQLLELGVSEEYISNFYDLYKLIPKHLKKREIHYWEVDKSAAGKRVLLLSHDLTFGGPAIALMHAAIILKANGYYVLYGSMLDGNLREILIENGISVIVDENLQWESMRQATWISGFDLVICNTINYCTFLRDTANDVPILWWLHDSDFFYGGVDKELLKGLSMANIKVVSVGKIPKKAMNKYRPDIEIGELLYGVE